MSTIKKGDVVEYGEPYSWEMRIGIVTSRSELGKFLVVAELGTGRMRIVEYVDAFVIHGYLHIDRPARRGF